MGVIAGDVNFTYQVYIRGALTIAEAWTFLEEDFNKKTLKNRPLVTKKLYSFKMEPDTKLAVHVDKFKELTLQMEEGVRYDKKGIGNKRRFNDKCFYYKKQGHNEFECREKTAGEGGGQVALAEASHCASSHMTSVRDVFVSTRDPKTSICITVADETKIDAVDGSPVSVSKLAKTNIVTEFSNDKRVFRCGDGTVMEAKRCRNVYNLKTVMDEECHVAATRKEPWTVMLVRLGHMPFMLYQQLLGMAEGASRVTDRVKSDGFCASSCIGTIRVDDFHRHPNNLVKSSSVLDFVHTAMTGPMQTTMPDVQNLQGRNGECNRQEGQAPALEQFGAYSERWFKDYFNRSGIKHEKLVLYTPQQNGLAEQMNRSPHEDGSLYALPREHREEVMGYAVNSVTQSVDHKPDPQFGYRQDSVQDRTPRKTTAQEHEGCRFMSYEDGIKGYRVQNVEAGKGETGDVIPLQHDVSVNNSFVPYKEEASGGIVRDRDDASMDDSRTSKANDQYLATYEGGHAMQPPKAFSSRIPRQPLVLKVTSGRRQLALLMNLRSCNVDTAFLYGKLNEEIYTELSEVLRELLSLAEVKGDDNVVFLFLQSLYGLKQASRVWDKITDSHLNDMGFKAAATDPCLITRCEGDGE
ncbi:hypothetical protein F442_09053 [Phytophthora nicotianae P10297]|uniref:Integrase catalytic domain-containing protein n=1 Tax=Phytophthora nicotianae P10297 TaxID=1317064 RepID=W2ZDT1_PHYNI|nr:hypothetical protein F442_09053 [Phytophthora nicotianae P10297]